MEKCPFCCPQEKGGNINESSNHWRIRCGKSTLAKFISEKEWIDTDRY